MQLPKLRVTGSNPAFRSQKRRDREVSPLVVFRKIGRGRFAARDPRSPFQGPGVSTKSIARAQHECESRFPLTEEERPRSFSSCRISQDRRDSLPVTLTISSGGDVEAVSLPGERSGKRSPEAAFVNRREQEEMPFGASPLVLFWSLRSGSDHVGPVRSGRAGAVGSADRSDRAGQGRSDRRAGQIRQGVHQSSSTSSYRWLPMPSCSA